MQKLLLSLLLGSTLLFSACKVITPKITRFEAPNSIVRGEKAVLLWDVIPSRHIRTVTLTNLADSLPMQGKAEVKPTKAQKYELRITYKHKRKTLRESRSVDIAVTEPVVKFVGTKKINIGEEARLDWELPHFAQKVRLSEWVDGDMTEEWLDVPSKAHYTITPIQNALYKLEYIDEGALKVLTHTIEVTPAFFTGTRKIIVGEEVQLIWKTNPHAPHISLEKRENSYTREIIKDQLTAAGNLKVSPTHTTEYLLSVIDVHHTTLLHKVEVVQGVINGQQIIKKGEKGYLSWRANPKAKKVWIETVENEEPKTLYANLDNEGQMEVKPASTTRYFLSVETIEGIAKYEHTLRVVQPNDAGIYTKSNVANGYDVVDIRHEKQASSLTNLPIVIEPHTPIDVPTKVYFDFSKSEIAEAYKAKIDEIIAKMKQNDTYIAEISGHADMKGTSKGCDAIAKERAEILKKYLMDAGIPEYRIITKSYGRMYPINYQETTETIAQENRRAEIAIFK